MAMSESRGGREGGGGRISNVFQIFFLMNIIMTIKVLNSLKSMRQSLCDRPLFGLIKFRYRLVSIPVHFTLEKARGEKKRLPHKNEEDDHDIGNS